MKVHASADAGTTDWSFWEAVGSVETVIPTLLLSVGARAIANGLVQ